MSEIFHISLPFHGNGQGFDPAVEIVLDAASDGYCGLISVRITTDLFYVLQGHRKDLFS